MTSIDVTVDRLLAELGIGDASLGGTDQEILAAARVGDLGPLLVDLAIRPPGESVSFERFLETSGLDPDVVGRVWNALGLPADGAVVVPPDVAEAVHIFAFLQLTFGDEATLALARGIRRATATIADALASSMRMGYEVPNLDAGRAYDDVTDEMIDAIGTLPVVEWSSSSVTRRCSCSTIRPAPATSLVPSSHPVATGALRGFPDVTTAYALSIE